MFVVLCSDAATARQLRHGNVESVIKMRGYDAHAGSNKALTAGRISTMIVKTPSTVPNGMNQTRSNA